MSKRRYEDRWSGIFPERARVIPEREAWLYESPHALALVRRGLNEARQGKVAGKAPDMKAAARLAAKLKDCRPLNSLYASTPHP
jgi:hypothetical protein